VRRPPGYGLQCVVRPGWGEIGKVGGMFEEGERVGRWGVSGVGRGGRRESWVGVGGVKRLEGEESVVGEKEGVVLNGGGGNWWGGGGGQGDEWGGEGKECGRGGEGEREAMTGGERGGGGGKWGGKGRRSHTISCSHFLARIGWISCEEMKERKQGLFGSTSEVGHLEQGKVSRTRQLSSVIMRP